jgi:hypothetical protein
MDLVPETVRERPGGQEEIVPTTPDTSTPIERKMATKTYCKPVSISVPQLHINPYPSLVLLNLVHENQRVDESKRCNGKRRHA